MPGLEWVFTLRDQVTRPAGSIESQLKRVSFALKSLDIATKQARLEKIADPLKKTRLELQLHRDKLLLSKRAIDEHTKSSTTWMSSIVKWAAAAYIFKTIAAGFRMIGEAASWAGEQAKEAIGTRQTGLYGLRSTMGNRAGGNFFEQLERQAQAYGRPPGEVVAAGAGFQSAGASTDLARKLVGAVYDVRAATGGRADISQQLQNILTSPVLDVGHLTGFAGALDLKKLWASFGKRMGMRPGDAEQVLAKRIPGQFVAGGQNSPLIQAVFDQLSQMPGGQGGVGNMARGFAGGTLPGAIGRVQSAMEQFLGSLDNSQGLKTLQNVLQNFARTLGGSSMRDSLRGLADALGDALKPLTGPEGRQRMEDFFASLTALLKGSIPLFEKAAQFADIIVRYQTGQRAPGAPQSIGEEVSQIGRWLFPGNKPAYLQSPYQQFGQPVINVNVDARGGQRFDPEGFRRAIQHEIARQRSDAGPTEINDAFDQLGVQSGAQ